MKNTLNENKLPELLPPPSLATPQTPKITTFGKVWRIGLLWITCPIWSILRAFIKTLATVRKYWICRMLLVWSDEKMNWALAGEKGLVDIKWYERKWVITTRKIFFPIDLALHIAVGTVIAPFKFIKSFAMSFRTAKRITKDICSDKQNEHCYSNGGWFLTAFLNLFRKEKIYDKFALSNPRIIQDKETLKAYYDKDYINLKAKKIISVENYVIPEEKDLKKDYCLESSRPRVTIVNKSSNDDDKSIRKHIQTILGLRSIKPDSEYNKYIHDDEINRLRYNAKISVLEER